MLHINFKWTTTTQKLQIGFHCELNVSQSVTQSTQHQTGNLIDVDFDKNSISTCSAKNRIKIPEDMRIKIENLIEENKIDKALSLLIRWSQENSNDSLRKKSIMMKSNLDFIKDKRDNGLIEFEEEYRKLAQIKLGTLNLIEQ